MKLVFLFSVVIVVISLTFVKRSTNNVCTTFEDYYTDRDNNTNCYYNPDHELTTPEIIKRWGYPVETHFVTTKDGYVLTVFRIPHGIKSASKTPGPPVYLQHGYLANSKVYVMTGKKSLAFILADKGYDVWLGNYRGTFYSRNHTETNHHDVAFWNFGYHEMGIYDLPAQLDLVYRVTKQKVIFIGHSMGATTSIIYSTTHPMHAKERVKIFILMAPFVFTSHMTLFPRTVWTSVGYIVPIMQALDDGALHYGFSERIWKFLCFPYPLQMQMCQIILMLACGFDYEQNDPETLPIALDYIGERSSVKILNHISQLVVSRDFRKYDFGAEENMRAYGSFEPPPYNLSNMEVPVYFVTSENDVASPKKDIQRLNQLLPKAVRPYDVYVVGYEKFNHVGFVWARDVVPLLYDHLVKFIGNL